MKRLLFIPILFLAVNVWAGPQLDGVAPDRALTKMEQAELKLNLRGLIHKELLPAKNDYVDDFNRGTVYFNPDKGNRFNPEALKARNYSYHKIVIPDGTIIEGVNFSQKNPHTVAIIGKNLTFIHCNLHNIEFDPTWITESKPVHSKHEIIDVDGKQYDIHLVEKGEQWVEVGRDEIINK